MCHTPAFSSGTAKVLDIGVAKNCPSVVCLIVPIATRYLKTRATFEQVKQCKHWYELVRMILHTEQNGIRASHCRKFSAAQPSIPSFGQLLKYAQVDTNIHDG